MNQCSIELVVSCDRP